MLSRLVPIPMSHSIKDFFLSFLSSLSSFPFLVLFFFYSSPFLFIFSGYQNRVKGDKLVSCDRLVHGCDLLTNACGREAELREDDGCVVCLSNVQNRLDWHC